MPSPARQSVARVLPDVTGLDKEFDYLIPDDLAGRLAVGEIVRVRLNNRSVRGWVTAVDPADVGVDRDKLQPIVKRSSIGPSADLVELARWASVRWAAGRLRPFLVAASPLVNVSASPAAVRRPAVDVRSVRRPAGAAAAHRRRGSVAAAAGNVPDRRNRQRGRRGVRRSS